MSEATARTVFVWAYGSLMSSASVAATLGPLPIPAGEPMHVTGWRRSWNCISSKTFLTDDGVRRRRVVVGIEPAAGHSCEGVLLRVDDEGFDRLRRRELAYDAVDLTDHVEPVGGQVLVFVPRPERVRGLVTVAEPLVVERAYFESCLAGALEHDLHGAAAELRSTLDLDLADPAGDVRLDHPGPVSPDDDDD
jgi:hypothetical protein